MGRWSFRKIKKGKMLKIVVDRNIEKSKHFFEKKKKGNKIDNPHQTQNQYNSVKLSFIQTINNWKYL